MRCWSVVCQSVHRFVSGDMGEQQRVWPYRIKGDEGGTFHGCMT